MYSNDFRIQEVNDYYARLGGIRTAGPGSHAKAGSFSGLIKRAAAQARDTTHPSSTVQDDKSQIQPVSDSDNACCRQCHAVNQMMLQMMSRSLYSQSALSSPLSWNDSWTAYQNMAGQLGRSLL